MKSKGFYTPEGVLIENKSIKSLTIPEKLNLNNVKPLEEVAGKMAKWFNLKTHPEFNGLRVALLGAELVPGNAEFANTETGEVGDYVRILCIPLGEDNKTGDPMVIYTGAENVVSRITSVLPVLNPDNPLIGTFRAAGRAWLLE